MIAARRYVAALASMLLLPVLVGCQGEPVSAGSGGTRSGSAASDGQVSGGVGSGGAPSSGGAASYSRWELGARPLPLRADGFGEMGPTPVELRRRRFRTVDVLPAPADGRFHASVGPVTAEVRKRMGATWSPRCPVGIADLSYLRVVFRGFDGGAHTGEIVVATSEAAPVVTVFRALFEADFPIEEMRLPTTADLEAPPTGDGNNTAGLVCRAARGQTSWSAHAYGLAIDVNPFLNPYHRDDVVLPELATSYLDRGWRRPGMVLAGSLAVREFARIGWSWGGGWSSLKDYQHFTATGR